jgi:hypothetical protein
MDFTRPEDLINEVEMIDEWDRFLVMLAAGDILSLHGWTGDALEKAMLRVNKLRFKPPLSTDNVSWIAWNINNPGRIPVIAPILK